MNNILLNQEYETFISIDIEADGPIPGENSMLSFGAVAINLNKEIVNTFERNLIRLPGAVENASTKKFWLENPAAYDKTRENIIEPAKAMKEFNEWLVWIGENYHNPVFIGWPVTFDFMFIHWYIMKFTGNNPLGWSGLDIKSLAKAYLKIPYNSISKSNMKQEWISNYPAPHIAIIDAKQQGDMALNIIRDIYGLGHITGLVNYNTFN